MTRFFCQWFCCALFFVCGSTSWASDPPLPLDSVLTAQDTLQIGTDSIPDAQQCLDGLAWTPAEFSVSFEEADRRKGDLVVRFPSAVPSGIAINDSVSMEWYQARNLQGEPITAPAVVVVHESGRGMEVGRLVAKGLALEGLHAFLIHLPGYGRRRGEMPLDDAEMFRSLKQAVADVRRARDAVAVLPTVDHATIGLQGTSLGGFVCATVAGLDRGYQRIFILLAGGNVHRVIEEGQKDAAGVRRRLEAAGITGQRLRDLTATIEPMRLAHRVDAENTWLFSGRFDDVVPPQCSADFAEAAKLPPDHHTVFLADHYSGIVQLPIVLTDIFEQMMGYPYPIPE